MKNNRKLRIFAVSPSIPRPDWQSGDRRFSEILYILARHFHVDLYAPAIRGSAHQCNALKKAGINIILGRHNFYLSLFNHYYDIGFFEFYYVAENYLRKFRLYQPHAKLIIDTVDIHFLREERADNLKIAGHKFSDTMKQRELSCYKEADMIVLCSESDRRVLLKETGNLPTAVIPNIIPIRGSKRPGCHPHVLFIGGFGHSPNIDAVKWFVFDIWPLIFKECPDARFQIVGSNPSAEIKDLGKQPGVIVIGYVLETTPYLDDAAVSVAPLRYGAGMKGKINEALASGLPVVTTSIGAEGFNAESDQYLIIADDPEEFARSVIALLKNPNLAERIGRKGQELAKKFSPDAVETSLLDMMAQLLIPYRRSFNSIARWRLCSFSLLLKQTIIFIRNVKKYSGP